jgi:hypothetical protein
MKQETLEEAYLNELIDEANKEWILDRKLAKEVAIKFANWQQERRYSEEDMKLAWEDGRNGPLIVGQFPFIITKFKHNSFTKWFEQFKKQ